MATYIEVNGNRYPAIITGRINDDNWNNRASKAIKLEMSYVDAVNMFADDLSWSIIQENKVSMPEIDENGNETVVEKIEEEIYDNSEYSIAGDIVDHRDGFVTIKMGKPTAEELLALLEEVL